MWKRGSRSSALDRAQALLSAQRSSTGAAESAHGSTAKARDDVAGSLKGRSALLNTQTLPSDLSDLSSVSSASEHGADTLQPAAAAAAAAGETRGREGDSAENLRPPSSLGGGSRFLKKPLPSVTNSSQSPLSQMHHLQEPRNVSSSQRSSQTAALNRLAQIESRIRSRKQAGQEPAENLRSDFRISSPPTVPSLEASVQLPAQTMSDHSLKGKRFLKKNTAVAVNNSNTAARSPQGPDGSSGSKSRAADAGGALGGLETKPARVVSGVSLDSDEDDMRKLLGDSLDSNEDSLLLAARSSSIRTANKVLMLSKSSQKLQSTPPPAAGPPSLSSNIAPPRSPASPSRRSSPFRFTGQAQAQFSPSVLSPSPSPPHVSPSPLATLNSPHREESPQRSLSSMSGHSEVLSLEELFPVRPGSEISHSDMSAVSSEDFKLNVMTLDDLVPASIGFTEGTQREEGKSNLGAPLAECPSREQLERSKEKKEKDQQEEDVPDYLSDFESGSRTEPDYSASQVSEHLETLGDDEVVSEVREEASDSDVSHGKIEDYSSTFSDTSRSFTSRSSHERQSVSRSRDSRSSRSSRSPGSRSFSHQSRCASTRNFFKEAGVQTQPDPRSSTWASGVATAGPAVGLAYTDPSPVLTHVLSAEMVDALSNFNPAVFALNEMLKQQLAMTRQFIEGNRRLHTSLMQSLEPPNYRYTTLEDTERNIHRRRPPKLTMEKAMEEVRQEMRLTSDL